MAKLLSNSLLFILMLCGSSQLMAQKKPAINFACQNIVDTNSLYRANGWKADAIYFDQSLKVPNEQVYDKLYKFRNQWFSMENMDRIIHGSFIRKADSVFIQMPSSFGTPPSDGGAFPSNWRIMLLTNKTLVLTSYMYTPNDNEYHSIEFRLKARR